MGMPLVPFCHFQSYWHQSSPSANAAAAAAKSLQSCPTLCDPLDGSPPGSPIPGILQARTLEWVAISFSNAWKWKVKVKSLSRVRPSVTPWTLPGSSIHGIFQARVLEWGAIAFSVDMFRFEQQSYHVTKFFWHFSLSDNVLENTNLQWK